MQQINLFNFKFSNSQIINLVFVKFVTYLIIIPWANSRNLN